jgi:hypothetical protein
MRGLFHQSARAFLVVFCAEALVFLASAVLAGRLDAAASKAVSAPKDLAPSAQLRGAH